VVGHRAAWKTYVRGNIVSESAALLIRNFLSACIAYTGQEDDEDEDKTKDKEFICSQLPLSVNNVHNIIDDMRHKEHEATAGVSGSVDTVSTDDASTKNGRTSEIFCSNQSYFEFGRSAVGGLITQTPIRADRIPF
jgi:hypothetical protein